MSEIEITEEMVVAGVQALHTVLGVDERYLGNDERAIIRVYQAMYQMHYKHNKTLRRKLPNRDPERIERGWWGL